ncbi:MAG: hotdog fold thioesterase [Bacteroidetes bacterium]|nr:hotdog fold thioesterase [Bacteroidota bacterium]
MTRKKLAVKTVDKMMSNDAFSKWMKLKILEVKPGFCKLSAKITKQMLNGYFVCHGGILFSIADSAFAFASNSHGKISVSINSSLAIPNAAKVGDTIIAVAIEISKSNKIGNYDVKLINQKKIVVGIFKGTVYRTSKNTIENEK